VNTGATLNGRALAQTAVTLDANAVYARAADRRFWNRQPGAAPAMPMLLRLDIGDKSAAAAAVPLHPQLHRFRHSKIKQRRFSQPYS